MSRPERTLDEYLSDAGSSRTHLLLSTRGAREVVVYSSAMDGLGHPTSDLDIYAVSDERRIEPHSLGGIAVGEVGPQESLDVEWWESADIARICASVNNLRARLDDLKVLHRLQVGRELFFSPDGIKKDLTTIALRGPVVSSLNLLVDDEIRTYGGFINMGNRRSALLTARRAATYATMAWCADQGRLIFKEKWVLPVLSESWPDKAAEFWTAMSRTQEGDHSRVFNFAVNLQSSTF